MESIPQVGMKPNTTDQSGDGGVQGNARLTTVTGIVLLVMLALEGVTILDVSGLITLHVFLGVMLIGPVLLKLASTIYRFARYYGGKAAYLRKGPPHIVLRIIGPFVILTSIAVLATGIGLLAVPPGDGPLLLLHKVSFVGWFVVMTIHVLGHLRDVVLTGWAELTQRAAGRGPRLAIVTMSIAAGIGLAALLLPSADAWIDHDTGSVSHTQSR